jgi:flagellar biosynthesis activator protein FlaF
MSQGASAYARTAKATQSPRELEASLLIRAALRFQAIHDNWKEKASQLDDALLYNRKLWTILVSSVTSPGNPLPAPIRQNIANIGIFMFNQTIQALAEPAPEKLAPMIFINKEIAAGLNNMPAAASKE